MARKKKNENASQAENENTEAPVTEGQTDEAAANAESPKAESKPICLVPGCGREAKIRGLCGRCGTAARGQIKKGKTTWEKLESLGLALAPKKAAFGGGEAGVFAKALKNALGGEE